MLRFLNGCLPCPEEHQHRQVDVFPWNTSLRQFEGANRNIHIVVPSKKNIYIFADFPGLPSTNRRCSLCSLPLNKTTRLPRRHPAIHVLEQKASQSRRHISPEWKERYESNTRRRISRGRACIFLQTSRQNTLVQYSSKYIFTVHDDDWVNSGFLIRYLVSILHFTFIHKGSMRGGRFYFFLHRQAWVITVTKNL